MTVRPFLLALALSFAPALTAQTIAAPESARSRAAVKRITPDLTQQLSDKELSLGADVFMQILKQDNQLRLYLNSTDGTYTLFKTYPICSWSGKLGPKLLEGDGQSPEGFYSIHPGQMNPVSSYHLSFNLGYPNQFDRVNGRTGSFLMVHGACVSIGCYAMTNPAIEEIWTLMESAYKAGQTSIQVHAFPFAMTDENLKTNAGNEWADFWSTLKPAWTAFEETKRPPMVSVVDKSYHIER